MIIEKNGKDKDVAKKGLRSGINTVYCRSRNEVFVCGHNGQLLCGNPKEGWEQVAPIPKKKNLHCLGEVDGTIYSAWAEPNIPNSWAIISWDGKNIRSVREDIPPWYLASKNDKLYVTWHEGAASFDGSQWQMTKGSEI